MQAKQDSNTNLNLGVGSTILVVDDDQSIRETLALLLEIEGFHTRCASNGKEAIDLLESGFRPDAIVLDLMMPVMNGWEFLEKRKQTPHYATIPAIIITAGNESIPSQIAEAVIRKPMKVDEILKTINQVLKGASPIAIPASPQKMRQTEVSGG